MDKKLFMNQVMLYWPNKELPSKVDEELKKNLYEFSIGNDGYYPLNVTSPEDKRDFPETISLMKKNNVHTCLVYFSW